jgi:hypothetical protein
MSENSRFFLIFISEWFFNDYSEAEEGKTEKIVISTDDLKGYKKLVFQDASAKYDEDFNIVDENNDKWYADNGYNCKRKYYRFQEINVKDFHYYEMVIGQYNDIKF